MQQQKVICPRLNSTFFFLRAHLGEENFQVQICKSQDRTVHAFLDVSHALYVQNVGCTLHFSGSGCEFVQGSLFS